MQDLVHDMVSNVVHISEEGTSDVQSEISANSNDISNSSERGEEFGEKRDSTSSLGIFFSDGYFEDYDENLHVATLSEFEEDEGDTSLSTISRGEEKRDGKDRDKKEGMSTKIKDMTEVPEKDAQVMTDKKYGYRTNDVGLSGCVESEVEKDERTEIFQNEAVSTEIDRPEVNVESEPQPRDHISFSQDDYSGINISDDVVAEAATIVCRDRSASDDQNYTCVICFGSVRNILLRPCNHLCLCKHCAVTVKLCPICRITITGREIVYV